MNSKMRPKTAQAVLYFAVFCVLLGGCTNTAPVETPRHVILLTVDTLRRDHLGAYGNPDVYTPNLDAMARQSMQYRTAVSPMARTNPSFATLHTGLNPVEHGVKSLFRTLGQEQVTIAEIFQERGFKTVFFNANPMLKPGSGFSQGFDFYIEPTKRLTFPPEQQKQLLSAQDAKIGHRINQVLKQKNPKQGSWLQKINTGAYDRQKTEPQCKNAAEYVTDAAIRYMDKHTGAESVFLWLLYMDPHWPYEPPSPYSHFHVKNVKTDIRSYDMLPMPQIKFKNTMDEATLSYLESLYMSEVDYLDHHIGRLLRHMDAAGNLENSLILFTADHGESLGEHGIHFCHGDVVYNDNIKVPLWVYSERNAAPELLDQVVPMADARDILMDNYKSQGTLSDQLEGKESQPVYSTTGSTSPENPLTHIDGMQGRHHSMIQGQYKMVKIPHPTETIWEMYDLKNDPSELTNIIDDTDVEIVATRRMMQNSLLDWISEDSEYLDPVTDIIPEDPRVILELKSLGYID